MTGLDRDTSKSPDRTGVCCTGRCAPSQCETITGPSFSSLNKPDQERTPAYRDSSGSESPSGCLLCYFFRRLGGAIWGIPAYISGDLAEWLEDQKIDHVRGAPYHPQTQGKIERWHQTLKNRILLENYFLPGDLERQIGTFVDHYNNHRYHESIGNVTPADAYFGRDTAIIERRQKIKKLTIQNRRLKHQRQAV